MSHGKPRDNHSRTVHATEPTAPNGTAVVASISLAVWRSKILSVFSRERACDKQTDRHIKATVQNRSGESRRLCSKHCECQLYRHAMAQHHLSLLHVEASLTCTPLAPSRACLTMHPRHCPPSCIAPLGVQPHREPAHPQKTQRRPSKFTRAYPD